MTLVFALLTVLALFAVAGFALATGMAATSYFALGIVLALYVFSRMRKAPKLALASQGR